MVEEGIVFLRIFFFSWERNGMEEREKWEFICIAIRVVVWPVETRGDWRRGWALKVAVSVFLTSFFHFCPPFLS